MQASQDGSIPPSAQSSIGRVQGSRKCHDFLRKRFVIFNAALGNTTPTARVTVA